jgi:hypothetical protein
MSLANQRTEVSRAYSRTHAHTHAWTHAHAHSHACLHTGTHTHTAGGATRAAVADIDFDPRLFGQPLQGAPSDSGGAAREAAGAYLRSRPARVRRRARTEEAQKEAFEQVGRMSCARPLSASSAVFSLFSFFQPLQPLLGSLRTGWSDAVRAASGGYALVPRACEARPVARAQRSRRRAVRRAGRPGAP